jgi:hypothetical protein
MNPDFGDLDNRDSIDEPFSCHPGDIKAVDHWPETKLPKKSKRLRLSKGDLEYIAESIEAAREAGIGTFHLPTLGNRKVKFNKDNHEHYINF